MARLEAGEEEITQDLRTNATYSRGTALLTRVNLSSTPHPQPLSHPPRSPLPGGGRT